MMDSVYLILKYPKVSACVILDVKNERMKCWVVTSLMLKCPLACDVVLKFIGKMFDHAFSDNYSFLCVQMDMKCVIFL